MGDMTRRQFIKIAGASTGAVVAGSALTTRFFGFDADAVYDPGTDGDRVVPTFCDMCFWKCGVLAHVRNGKVTKINGNPAHPLSRELDLYHRVERIIGEDAKTRGPRSPHEGIKGDFQRPGLARCEGLLAGIGKHQKISGMGAVQ